MEGMHMKKTYIPNVGETAKIITSKIETNLNGKTHRSKEKHRRIGRSNMKRELNLTKIFKTITIIVTIILIIILIYFIQAGIFEDQTKLINYIKQFGLFGVLLFILLQAIQVIFPVIPGGASCLIGVLSFGPILGFIYNYIGLTLGSILAYLLAKTYGLALIRKLFKPQTIDKYLKYLKTSKFNKIFLSLSQNIFLNFILQTQLLSELLYII